MMDNRDVLQHHGILGQKWGVRRYQNKDGSLTSAGRKRYGVEETAQSVGNTVKKKIEYKIKKSNEQLRRDIDPLYRYKKKEEERQEKERRRIDPIYNMRKQLEEWRNGEGIPKGSVSFSDSKNFVSNGQNLVKMSDPITSLKDLKNRIKIEKGKTVVDHLKDLLVPTKSKDRYPWDEKPSDKQPWDEKPSDKQPWDEKPSRIRRNN